MTPLRLALWQYPVERLDGVDAFARKLDLAVSVATRAGAEMVALPEYACMELGAADTRLPDAAAELASVTARADAILDAMREVARRRAVWLLGGSLPVRNGTNAIHNRAPLIAPDGRIAFQDKHVMTRFEAEEWRVQPGAPPSVFQTPWGKIGIAICYDVEFPSLVRAQVEAGAWLILVPTCTDTLHGFNRVRLAARARAVENQCFVAITPTVGQAPWSAALDGNRGYAAVFAPVDRGFPEDGVIARGALDEVQWVFADLAPERLAAVRSDGAVRNHRDWPALVPTSATVSPA